MNPPRHPVLRSHFTVNMLFVRFFVVFSIGPDRRDQSTPVGQERRFQSTLLKLMISLVTFTWFMVAGLLIALVMAYLLKQALNIDLFADIHPLSDSLKYLNICHRG